MSILNRLKNSAKTLANNAQNAAKNAAQSAVTGAVNTAQSAVNNAVNTAQNVANNLQPTVNNTVNAVQGAVNTAQSVASNTANAVQNAAPGIIGSAGNAVNTTQNAVSDMAQSANQIGSTVKDTGASLAGSATNAGKVLYNAAGQIAEQPSNAGTVIQNAAGELATEAGNAASTVQNAAGVIAGEANNIYNTAQDAVASVTNDVNNITGTAQNAVNDIFGGPQRENLSNPVSGSQAPAAGGTTGTTGTGTGGTTGTGTGGTTGTGGNQTITSSDLTTADINARQNTLLQEMMNFWNTPFQYNAKESPLYTILQQQQAKEARLASGRAYSRAVANTGGFGSSYATLAAEEAGRQVMEGLDDQQYDLYQAAKDEWKSKWTNMVEEYNFLTGVQDRENAKSSERKQMVANSINDVRNVFGTTYNEEAIRAHLAPLGYTEAEIQQVLKAHETYSKTQQGTADNELVEQGAAYVAEAYGTGYNANQIREDLKARGYSDAVINRILQIQYSKTEYYKGIQNGEYYTTAMSYVKTNYGSEYNEDAIRAELKAMNIPDDVIEQVLAVQEMRYEDTKTSQNKEAYNEAMAIVSEEFGYGYDEQQIKAVLEARGYSAATINEVLASQQKVANAFGPLVKGERVTSASNYLRTNYGDDRDLTAEDLKFYSDELKNLGYTDDEIKQALAIHQAYVDHMSDSMAGQEYASALSLVSQSQGTAYNESLIRSILTNAGYSEDVIQSVLETQTLIYEDAQTSANKEAYNEAMAIVSEAFGYGYDEQQIKAVLEASGYSEATINEVLASQKKLADAFAPLVKGERVNAAADYLKENFGDYRELTNENLDMFKQALKNEGYTDEEINDAMVFYQAYIGHLNDMMEGQEYASALALVSQIQGTSFNEAIIRDILNGAGYSDDVINSVVETQQLIYDDAQASANKDAYNSAMAIVSEAFKYEYDESQIRAILEAKGYSDEIIDEVLASQQKVADAFAPLVRGEKVTMASNYLKTNYDYDTDLSEEDLNLFREELEQMGYSADEIEQAIDLHQAYVNHLKDNLAGEEYISAMEMVGKWFGTGYNEAAIRQMLTEAGYSDEVINDVLQVQNMIYTDVQNKENREKYAEGVQFIRDSYGLTYNREAIESDLLKLGYTPEEIVGILANHKAYVDAMQPLVDKEVIYNSVNDLISAVPEYNEEAAMAYLDALGLSDTQYAQTMSIYRNFMEAMTGDGTEEERMPENVVSASQDLLSEFGTEYAPETMRQYLLNNGYTEEEANAAIDAHRTLNVNVLKDYNPTSVSDAQSFAYTLKEKLDGGLLTVEEYDALVEKNGAYIMQYITPALDDINAVDYTAFGISQEEWDSMDDGERKAEIFDMAGQLRKENMITSSQFYGLVYTDLKDVFASDEYLQDEKEGKMNTWINMAKTIQGYYNSGYVNQDMYVDFLYNVVGKEMWKDKAWIKFVDYVKDTIEDEGENVTRKQFEHRYSHSNMFPYFDGFGILDTYGNNRKERNESKDLVFEMAKFMAIHGWDSSILVGNTTGSTSTGVSTGNTSMEVTQDVR